VPETAQTAPETFQEEADAPSAED